MRPEQNRRSRRPSSPASHRHNPASPNSRHSTSPPRASASILFDDVTADVSNPRSFPHSVKKQCWEKAEKIKGRDPEHRLPQARGLPRLLTTTLCPTLREEKVRLKIVRFYRYLHYSDNLCRRVQRRVAKVNRSKGNRTEFSRAELISKSSYCRVSGRDMDLIELSAYGTVSPAKEDSYCEVPGRGIDLIESAKGNIRNAQEFWGCSIQ